MARRGVGRTNMLLHLGRSAGISSQKKVATKTNTPTTSSSGKKKTIVVQVLQEDHSSSSSSSSSSFSCCWVPHPRTGIYFPVGHDWVMEDVPDGAATFSETCCFRN